MCNRDGDLVSVIVPTYNRAYCVCRTIDSVREQTYPNWELVLVDDGSTDGTADVIESRYGDDARIRYIYESNSGASAARNTGIRASRGNYIALLDSDDVWKPWKLEVQVACFRTFPEVGMIWTNFEAVNTAGEVVDRRYLTTMYNAYRYFESFDKLFEYSRALTEVNDYRNHVEPGTRVYIGNIYTQMLRGNLVHTSTVLVARERIEKVKQFDETLSVSGEDYDFHFRTCKWGKVGYIDTSSTAYQLDYEDRLSQYGMKIAQNFLQTVTGAISRENGSTTFPRDMIDDVLAEAHAWIAEEFFTIRDSSGVRQHALCGLNHRFYQPRLIAILGLATLPGWVSVWLLKSYHYCKHLFFRLKKSRVAVRHRRP